MPWTVNEWPCRGATGAVTLVSGICVNSVASVTEVLDQGDIFAFDIWAAKGDLPDGSVSVQVPDYWSNSFGFVLRDASRTRCSSGRGLNPHGAERVFARLEPWGPGDATMPP